MPKHYRPPGKKKEGNAAKYMTRTKAVKYLQVSLQDFRRLCVLKGVFPREPKKKFEGNHKTYYHVKDIMFLAHEPLLEKFREMRAHGHKVNKALAKKNKERAERLKAARPSYKLDRLVRERYPSFIDALRDLDDCLSMVHLFATLPAVERERIEVSRIHNCRRLSHEWQAYISRTHSLRKVFIAVKGIYYQAEVQGQKITWLTPHALQQVLTDEVDFNVMLTFLEFYETLLAFVNFRLYHSINVKYPPILDPQLEALAEDLYALFRYFAASSRARVLENQDLTPSLPENADLGSAGTEGDESDLRLAQLQLQLPTNTPGALMQLVEESGVEDTDDDETRECKSLFKNLKFFLSREVQRESLLFIIPAFGGVVSWEGGGAPFKETDEGITHQIVDRPSQCHMFLSREYVQPQWVFDCVNARILLPTDIYAVGRVPPPHLSPFVDNEAEGYVPEYAEKIKRLQAAARKDLMPMPGLDVEDIEDPQNILVAGVISRTEANEAAETKREMSMRESRYHDELKMELQGIPYSASRVDMNMQIPVEDTESKEETLPISELAVNGEIMMSNRRRKIYKAMMMGQEKKKNENKLLEKRKKLAKAKKSA
ncbi:Pescadillo-like protein [Thalictrum thalictroides]|uniref:Pescadillo homolog n=1 Tax=Thalictrum thalictroides TaxID=46969 RepID=A0A7J6WN85_THATH|nr:Pescadillo-like protein [Thalictrum thalictroides]